MRLNRNYKTGAVEVDLGRDSTDYQHTLKSRDDLRDVLSHIAELKKLLGIVEAEVTRALQL